MRYKTTTRIPFELPSSSKQDLSDAPKDSTEAAVAFYTDKRASNTLPSDIYPYRLWRIKTLHTGTKRLYAETNSLQPRKNWAN